MSRLTKYDHLPEFVRRRLQPGNSYPLAREHPSRRLQGIRVVMEKLDPAEMQQPTQVEIAELAIELATEEWPWIHQKFEAIQAFHFPPWAEPPPGRPRRVSPVGQQVPGGGGEAVAAALRLLPCPGPPPRALAPRPSPAAGQGLDKKTSVPPASGPPQAHLPPS